MPDPDDAEREEDLEDEELDDEAWEEWIESEHDVADMPEEPASFTADEGDDHQEDDDEDEDDESEPAAAEDEEPPPPTKPSGPSYPEPPCTLVVAQGDCLLSLALRYRMSERTIWDAGPNAALRASREHPNQLAPGDELHIPAREDKAFAVQTEKRHRFSVSSRPDCEIVIRLLEAGAPRAGVAYTLLVDGQERTGVADGDGRIRERVGRGVRSGTMVVHLDEGDQRFPVRIGHLDPIATVTGVQARLNHLGFSAGATDGWLGPRSRRSLRLFQHARELPISGELDAATRDELRKVHGS